MAYKEKKKKKDDNMKSHKGKENGRENKHIFITNSKS